MLDFFDWLIGKDAAARLRLLEHAEFFDPQAYNQVFESELEKLLNRVPDHHTRQQVIALRGFDWGGYLSRSLQRAGFRDDENFHSIVVKLLVSPGRLFKGWEPHRHGPLDRRFRRSAWNAIRNAAEKTRTRRKWMQPTDPTVMAGQFAGRSPYSGLTDEFRELVAARLGALAAAIVDARLAGRDTKELVGQPDLGSPSAYSIKRAVQGIKELAQQFAARSGDTSFLNMVARAMEAQSATIEKRKAAVAARARSE